VPFLDRQIGHAQRRLTSGVFLAWLSLGLLVAAGLWAVVIVAVRLLALPIPLWHGAWAAALAAAIIALIGTALARPSALRAAIALDSAAGLKERLSTALVVRGMSDPFARAAVRDAEKAAAKVHVPTHIRLRPPTLWPWSAATVLAAVILARFMPSVGLFSREAQAKEPIPRAMVEAERQAIQAELQDRVNRIKELSQDNANLKDLAEQLEPLELAVDPGLTPEDIRREAVKRIDAVGEKLKRELESTETNPLSEMKRRLSRVQAEGGDQPGAKLSQSLASGDFEGAKQAMEKLREQIQEAAKKAEDPEAARKLAEMQQQLTRLAEQITRLSDTLQLQKELENKAGLSEEQAKKLLDELSKMDAKQLEKELQKRLGDKGLSPPQLQQLAQRIQQQKEARQACQKLAQAMSKAAQACQQCQSPGGAGSGSSQAAAALSDAASQLSELELSEQLVSELQAQLSDLENLRDDVCQGRCQGKYGRGKPGSKIGLQGPQAGLGMGERIGKEKTPYKLDPTKAPTRFQGGTIIGQMLVDGPQVRGQASAEVLGAAQAELRDALDAIEREEVPRQYRKALQEYFERLAGLVREKQAAAGKTEPTEKSEPTDRTEPGEKP
jgi:hypothetical protein